MLKLAGTLLLLVSALIHLPASAAGLTAEQVERVYKDIDQKRRTTHYLHARPRLVEAISEVHG